MTPLDKSKSFWNQLTSEYLDAFLERCPGRRKEANVVLSALKYNALVYLNSVSPLFRHPAFKQPRLCAGFLVEGKAGSGRTFFCNSLSLSHPCVLNTSCRKDPIAFFDSPHVSMPSLLCVVINLDVFSGHHNNQTLGSLLAENIALSHNDALADIHAKPLCEALVAIHNLLVQELSADSSLENVLRLVLSAGLNLKALFRTHFEMVKQAAKSKSVHYLEVLLHKTSISDHDRAFFFMGGCPLWVIFKNIGRLAHNTSKYHHAGNASGNKSQSYMFEKGHEFTLIVELLRSLVERCRNGLLPVLCTFTTEPLSSEMSSYESEISLLQAKDEHLRLPSSAGRDAHLLQLSFLANSNYFDYRVSFPFPLAVAVRQDIILWAFRQREKICSPPSPPLLQRLIECTSALDIPGILTLINELCRQQLLNSIGAHSSFDSKVKIAINDAHLDAALKRTLVPRFSQLTAAEFVPKPSLCAASHLILTPAVRWISLSRKQREEDDPWFGVTKNLIEPFHQFQQQGWPTSLCVVEGETGAGKSHLCSCLAEACNVAMFRVRPSDIMKPLLGSSEKAMAHIFAVARSSAPCIIALESAESWCHQNAAVESVAHTYSLDKMSFGECSLKNPGPHYAPPSPVTVRLSQELLRQIDTLRLVDNKNSSLSLSPILVVVVTTLFSETSFLDSRLYLPHRQAARVRLPQLASWTPDDMIRLVSVCLPPDRFRLCVRQREKFLATGHTFTHYFETLLREKWTLHSFGPGVAKQFSSQIEQQTLRRRIFSVTPWVKSLSEKDVEMRCESPSLCVCDVVICLRQHGINDTA